MPASATIVIVMGVSGAGKSTIGARLADELGWPFEEGDDYHSDRARRHLARGQPLTDADRAPWLARLGRSIASHVHAGRSMVLACSALKEAYRSELRADTAGGNIVFVYLKVPEAVAAERLKARAGHFASETLAPSQFADLEEPGDAITIDATRSPAQVVTEVVEALRERGMF